jgi:radical SAM superfamily enzyme YgiQ (UPF0313 family)
MHVLRMIDICAAAKAACPQALTIVGGHHATLLPQDFHCAAVDLIVVGEGTGPFRQILEHHRKKRPFFGIAGVWRKGKQGYEYGGKQPEIDLDLLPQPDRLITGADRSRYFIDWMRPIALARTTVGCPYRCSFCSLWRVMDGKYYRRDVSRVAEELAAIQERYVFLVDDEPFINPHRMRELANALISNGVDKEYFAYCRIDTLLRNRDVLELWMKAGLRRVFLGIEGITAREMTDYAKRLSIQQVEQGLATAREMGLKVFASFIVNPNYGPKEFNQLVRFIERNKVDYPSFTILTPLPGTDDFHGCYETITKRQPNGRPDWPLWDLQSLVLPSRLREEEFMREYQGLRRVFRGRYELYQRQAAVAV